MLKVIFGCLALSSTWIVITWSETVCVALITSAGGQMAPLVERLVGREAEIGRFEWMLDELDRGRPGAIELVGEAGIGKTRLLRELAARGEARGHIVLDGPAHTLRENEDVRRAYLGEGA